MKGKLERMECNESDLKAHFIATMIAKCCRYIDFFAVVAWNVFWEFLKTETFKGYWDKKN